METILKNKNSFLKAIATGTFMLIAATGFAQKTINETEAIHHYPMNISQQNPTPQNGVKRTDLQKHDLSIAGKEMVQARIDFDAHTSFGKHSHPGEEIIYVLEGALEYQIEDENPVILKAGQVLFIPAGKIHSAKNHTNVKASELATYIVEKGKPILVMKK